MQEKDFIAYEYTSKTVKAEEQARIADLYEAFGWEVPVYVHCPTITNEEHKKLSKRSGHSSYQDLIDQGFISEAVVNFVALLGWSPENNQEIFSLDELVKEFNYKNISKSPAVFDMVKLKWMNGEYIKAMDFDKFYEMAEPYIKKVITKDLDLKKIAAMVKTRIEIFPDIEGHIDFVETVPEDDPQIPEPHGSRRVDILHPLNDQHLASYQAGIFFPAHAPDCDI